MRNSKHSGGLSDAGSVVHGRASCLYVLVDQHVKAGASAYAGLDESPSDGLNVEPVLLRDLYLSQTVCAVGHQRRNHCLWSLPGARINTFDAHFADRSGETSRPLAVTSLSASSSVMSLCFSPEVRSASGFGSRYESSTIHTWAGERCARSSSSFLTLARSTAGATRQTAGAHERVGMTYVLGSGD